MSLENNSDRDATFDYDSGIVVNLLDASALFWADNPLHTASHKLLGYS